MGKAKREKKKPKVQTPLGVASAQSNRRETEAVGSDQTHVSKKEVEIQTVLEQLQSAGVEDRVFGLHSLATVFEDAESIGDVLQHKIVKLAGPLLLEKNSFVRNAAAGALRNLSKCGSHEICDLLIEQDIMTPLTTLIQQYADDWEPVQSKKDDKVDERVDTFVQAVHLLWNLCESNSRALKYFNDRNLLPILVKCLDFAVFGLEASVAVAHCLSTVSEDNIYAIKKLKESESKLLSLVSMEVEDNASILLRVLACGLILNLNRGSVYGLEPTTTANIMKAISDTLEIDQRVGLKTLTSNMPADKDDLTIVHKKMEEISSVKNLLEAQQTALEILANLCSDSEDADDEAMDQDLSDASEELFNGLADDEPSTTETFSPSIAAEVHEAIVGHDLVGKVWAKTTLPPDNVCLILREHPDGKLLFNKVSTLRCRAFLCLNNLLSGLDMEDVGGPADVYNLWLEIGKLIFKEVKPEETELLEAATSAMRAALQRLAEVKTNLFGQIAESDLQLMFNGVQQCVDANVRANLIRSVGTLGMIILTSTDENSQTNLKNIGKFLLEVSAKEQELWVVAEALDTLMDVFGEDETDAAAAHIHLVDKLNAIVPALKHKVRLQRKSLGEHHLLVTTVNVNLNRFIKYKADRLAALPVPKSHSNGQSS